MKIMAVDTCSDTCSVAISDASQILSLQTDSAKSKQAEILVPLIKKSLEKALLRIDDISLMATTVGPGSFTGARIGLSALKGIMTATSIPILGVSTLELIAFKARFEHQTSEKFILSIIDAKRGQLYIQKFKNNENIEPVTEASLCHIEDVQVIDECIVASNSKSLIKTFPDICLVDIGADDVSNFAVKVQRNPQENVTPLYIRPPDAKLPSKKS